MRRIYRRITEYVPGFCLIVFGLLLVSLLLYFLARVNMAAADFLNSTVSVALRQALGGISSVFSFSLFELLLILALPIAVITVVIGLRVGKDTVGRVKFIAGLLTVISLISVSYIFTLGVGYHTTPLSAKLGLPNRSDISTDELYRTAVTVRDEVNRYSETVGYRAGESIMGYSVDSLSEKLSEAYMQVSREYSLGIGGLCRAKPVLFSTVMSDAGITGIYSFFTGETNVNVEYPDYYLPFTAAHEFAHARGIARENEANFMAYLVCISSDDVYIRYSGYLNMYSYLAGALYRADEGLYNELRAGLSDSARSDILAASRVTEAHRDSILGKFSDKANDLYLKSNGEDGVVTYGYVVRLAVGYHEKIRDGGI